MDQNEGQDSVFSTQGEEAESPPPEETVTEGTVSLRWQREEGRRISRRKTMAGRYTRTPTPTPYRVSAMPNTLAGARGESDSDDGAEVSKTSWTAQRQHKAATGRPDIQIDQLNQQLGAPPGAGVLAGGPLNAALMPRRQILSPVRVGPSRQTNPTNFELYPMFTLLQQSLAAPTPCTTARS